MNAMTKDRLTAAMDDNTSTTRIEAFTNLTDAGFRKVRRVYEALATNRETLAVLFALDAAQTNPTEQWVTFFVETASAQLIWDERPSGTVSASDAAWVLERFDEAPTLSVLAILARLVEEAQTVPVGFSVEVRQRAVLFGSLSGAAPAPRAASHLRLVA